MRKLSVLWFLVVVLGISSSVFAQTATPVPSATDTNVNYFFVACDASAVLDLSGVIQRNYDVYFQVFKDLGARGTPLTELQRVSVNGQFQVSPAIVYTNSQFISFGQFASLRLLIARETDPTNILYEDVVDDVQDGCATPTYSAVPTTPTGSGTTGATVVNPVTGESVVVGENNVVGSSGIFRPDGGFLNEIFAPQREEVVQIGARPSEIGREAGRTSNPGLIFAECNAYPLANPGRLFDTDRLTVYWSWFAKTPAQVQQHIDNALYTITLNGQPFPVVVVSEIRQLSDNNYWVFYTADLGDAWQPGSYGVNFQLEWRNAISDGYARFGPGTRTERVLTNCTFNIEKNPYGVNVQYRNPSTPLQQHLR
jgi:hypothetical protein